MPDESIVKEVVKSLRRAADDLEAGNSNITFEQGVKIIKTVSHVPISREAACKYVNMNSNKFNDYMAIGKIPKGRKRFGFKELVWYEDELDDAIDKMRNYK